MFKGRCDLFGFTVVIGIILVGLALAIGGKDSADHLHFLSDDPAVNEANDQLDQLRKRMEDLKRIMQQHLEEDRRLRETEVRNREALLILQANLQRQQGIKPEAEQTR